MPEQVQGDFGFLPMARLCTAWAAEDWLARRAALEAGDDELAALVALGMRLARPLRSFPIPARFADPELEPTRP